MGRRDKGGVTVGVKISTNSINRVITSGWLFRNIIDYMFCSSRFAKRSTHSPISSREDFGLRNLEPASILDTPKPYFLASRV